MATSGEQATLRAENLFSCEGLIALVTGGGTGATPASSLTTVTYHSNPFPPTTTAPNTCLSSSLNV